MQKLLPALVIMSLTLVGTAWLSAGDKGKPMPGKALQGTWTATKGEAKMSLTFAGEKFTLTKSRGEKSEDITGTFKVDATKTPKTIDMMVTGGSAKEIEKYKGKTSLGIYKIEADKLEWCAGEPGMDARPAAFEGGKGHLHIMFDREKK